MAAQIDTARAYAALRPLALPASYFLDRIDCPLTRARCAAVIRQHDEDMEAARLADEAAGYLDIADEPSPSDLSLEADLAASFSQVA
jgi:hypothetical protein